MELDEAYGLITRAIDTGHPAHGYLIVGDVRGNCAELVRRILHRLFPEATEQVDANTHPDVVSLEPEGKGRVISVDAMRARIVEPMSTTAFSGGWKVGVIQGVDRLNPQSANAFLKSLEEPPPLTMYLLLTDQPDAILPTIVSRTQRIDLPLSDGVLEGESSEAVADAFVARDSKRLAELLKDLLDEAEETDAALVRKAFYRTIMSFARQMMIGGRLPLFQAFRNVEAVEDAYRQSERSLQDEAVLSFMLDRMVFPKPNE